MGVTLFWIFLGVVACGFVACMLAHNFRNEQCCRLPSIHKHTRLIAVCRCGKAWLAEHGRWRRISQRRYMRESMSEVEHLVKVTSSKE